MIEEVKMIMDEQTKRTVDSLRSSLEEVFAPLNKLEGLDSRLAEIGGGDELVSAVRRSIRSVGDVQDSIDSLSGKLAAVVSMQETIIAAIGEIKAAFETLRKPAAKKLESPDRKKGVGVKKAVPGKAKAKAKKKSPAAKSGEKNNPAAKRKANPSKANRKMEKPKRKGGK